MADERLLRLVDLAARLSGTLDPAEVKARAVYTVSRLVDCEAASIILRGPKDALNFDVAVGGPGLRDDLKRIELDLSEGIAGRVIRSGEPYLTNDAGGDPAHSDRVDRELGYTTRGLVCVPIETSDGVIGCLQAINAVDPGGFREADIPLLASLANFVGVAIENARLHERLKATQALVARQQVALVEAEKLTAMGQLSAGVAHEIRSPLSAISGYAQLIRRREADEKILRPVRVIEDAASHINRIVNGLLDFARKDEPRYEPALLNDVVRAALEFSAGFLGQHPRVQLVEDLADGLPEISADVRQLRQVFANLFLNAAQAMPEGGTLTIETFGEPPAGREGSDEIGRVVLLVHDTGAGISKDDVDKVFQPFFTSGKEGGWGLGLSFCRSIVQNHRGAITFETAEGRGTTFRVHLPVMTPEV